VTSPFNLHSLLRNYLKLWIQDFELGAGDESRREVWGPLKVSSRSRAKLLGFEYLGSFSVNNFEAFCECDEVYRYVTI
jgi:hypothetical protein